jgi:hypothetical protein
VVVVTYFITQRGTSSPCFYEGSIVSKSFKKSWDVSNRADRRIIAINERKQKQTLKSHKYALLNLEEDEEINEDEENEKIEVE